MFEDSTFESTGSIRTHSRGWTIAAFAIDGSILLATILIPLIHPEALPRQALPFLVEVPSPPSQPPLPKLRPAQAFHGVSEMQDGHIFAPQKIPTGIAKLAGPEEAPGDNSICMEIGEGAPGGDEAIFRGRPARVSVRPQDEGPVSVPSAVEAGLIVQKTIPVYPPLGKAMRLEGVVELAATISKTGTIENLRAVSGSPILQRSALDAVKTWRYRPYRLNGEPVEVETTVNVVFVLER
jgi:protein TonB